jgi:hypothetical protein
MNNLLSNSTSQLQTVILGNSTYPITTLQSRLDALILVLKTCKGKVCSDPWEKLLPGSDVSTLAQAMKSTYDEYFAKLPKVSYSACEDGYLLESEGPVWEDEGYVDVHNLARRGRAMNNRP